MSDNLLSTLNHLEYLREKSGLPLDKVFVVLREQKLSEAAQHDARAASQENRDNITAAFEELNGKVVEMTRADRKDLLVRIGVPVTQGTMAFARHLHKKLLLTFQSQAETPAAPTVERNGSKSKKSA